VNATDLLDQRDHVLLDFDGPVCSVFGGEISNVRAADCLRSIVKGAVLPAEIANGPDPFAVLRFSAQFENGARLADVAAELERLEREAVRTAPPTVAIARVLDYLASAGHFVTIVSNNSAAAVADFLSRHGLERLARGIAARRSADPSLLKPAPYLVEQAMADASVPRNAVCSSVIHWPIYRPRMLFRCRSSSTRTRRASGRGPRSMARKP